MDGFNLNETYLKSIFCSALPYARSDEIYTKVLKAPKEEAIKIVTGYLPCPKKAKHKKGKYCSKCCTDEHRGA